MNHVELTGEWPQNSQWMQMLHCSKMLPSPSSAFHPPPITPMFNFWQR